MNDAGFGASVGLSFGFGASVGLSSGFVLSSFLGLCLPRPKMNRP
jgi:hypothetical protein